MYDEGLMYSMNVFNYLKFIAFACVSATSVLRLSCASSSSTQSVAAVACISLWCVRRPSVHLPARKLTSCPLHSLGLLEFFRGFLGSG